MASLTNRYHGSPIALPAWTTGACVPRCTAAAMGRTDVDDEEGSDEVR